MSTKREDAMSGKLTEAPDCAALLSEALKVAKEVIGADKDDTWDTDREWLVEAARDFIRKAKEAGHHGN